MRYALAMILLAARVNGADLPEHAVAVDKYGTWACERGYTLKDHRCISDAVVGRAPQVEIATVPSAGDGSRTQGSCPEGGCGAAIEDKCAKEWPTDYAMQLYCIKTAKGSAG